MSKTKVVGAEKVLTNWRSITKRGERAFLAAMYREGLRIIRDSIPRVPVVTGRLKNTHYVEIPTPTKRTVRIGYGTKYAWNVHEGIKIRIKDQPRRVQRGFWANVDVPWRTSDVGGPKYLEHAVDATRGGRQKRINKDTKMLLEQRRSIGIRAAVPTEPKE